ncbi:protein containing CheW-like domain [marine gamma proteobacterium HTCC2143]|uniref:Protein containing CheW-like domain n=1 Tax=marine gamma proteobacterium HTCC2143 TaxID=247633 RepID=A0YC72_9GAMM|nr:protein containing CheW-like domain [marine gamma proteobacterium HTCC2143]
MSSKPSDSGSGNDQDNSEGFVQDYLDLLLGNESVDGAAEPIAPRALKPMVSPALQRRSSDFAAPLVMVAGTDMKPIAVAKNSSVAVQGKFQSRVSIPLDGERRKRPPAVNRAESQSTLPVTQWLNGRPLWAQRKFECVLFKVSGLTVALPSVEFEGIYPMAIESLVVKDKGLSSMGLLSITNGPISVIDTASVVMPEQYDGAMRERFNYVVAIKGMSWGLAVDSIVGAHVQDIAAVTWRSDRTTRPWLAATVTDHAIAIVEVNLLNAMFQQSPQN